MLRRRRFSENYRELFVARYDQLLAWAMQLSQGDRAVAEDLLHDLYVLFSIHQPNIDPAQNVDGYLYTCLRNLYLSQIRRAARIRFQQLSIVEYESAKTGLRAIDPRTQIEVQDELRRVCQYACARKETSRMGSVLILRFFHGYYPSEIVRVLRTSRKAVDGRLALARAEARTYLDNIEGLAFMTGDFNLPEIFPANFARTPVDLLSELRQKIFASRQGDCLSHDHLHSLYQRSKRNDKAEEIVAMSCAELAHLVSCVACLNEVNSMLKLSPLSQRYLTDASGKDPGGRGGDGGSSTGGGPRQAPKSAKARKLIESGRLDDWDDDAREAFEHKPQELCVAVNGYLMGSQRVGLEQNDLTLSLNPDEKPTFVEVFSEQGIRLSMMSIGDPPPEGTGEQRLQVNLSDARELELTLQFTEPFMTLRVAYHDPALRSEADALESEALVVSDESVPFSRQQPETSETETVRRRFFSGLIQSLRARLFTRWFWLRPGTVTALVALVLIGCLLLYLRSPAPLLSAAELLSRAATAEESITARTDQVIHRTISLEERVSEPHQAVATGSATQQVVTRRRIEIWHSAEKGVTARRLFDDRGALVAGDWRRSDGVQTLYHHGSKPQLQLTPEKRDATAISFESVWQFSPSAREFLSLIGNTEPVKLEERGNVYVISAKSAGLSASSAKTSATSAVNYLVRATLTLSRDDLHPLEQTVVIRQGGETREYRFVETGFERRALDAVAPTVFEPEPELVSERNKDEGGRMKEKSGSVSPLRLSPLPAAASVDLEVEVLRLLSSVGADLGEQITVKRETGVLQVRGMVETPERKAEILNALQPQANNPAVEVEIETYTEAVARQSRQKSNSSIKQEAVGTENQQSAAENELVERLGSTAAARAFSSRMVDTSWRAMNHAYALRRLSRQFTTEQLRSMKPESRAKWLALIARHADSFRAETQSLRGELQKVFGAQGGGGSASAVNSWSDVPRAVERLVELASSNDQVIRSAFTVSSETRFSAVRTPQFWDSLKTAEALAGSIAEARTK